MSVIAAAFVFLAGLMVGSFLNVAIHRVPRDESVAWPPSHCPTCTHRLAPRDLVPLASWLALGGRCRYCRAPISPRYPLVELVTGLLYLGLYLRFGARAATLAYVMLASLLVALTFIDVDHQILPDVMTIPGLLLGLGVGLAATLARQGGHPDALGLWPGQIPALFDPFSLWGAVLGALVGGGVISAVILISRGGMGWGDAKLLAMIGAFTGWRGALATLFLGAIAGSVVGVALLATKKKTRKDPIPFGPFLALGCLFLFFGDQWLLRVLGGWR